MKKMSNLTLIGLLFLIGCVSKESANTKSADLHGEWRNVYLKITLNEVGGESLKVTECDSAHWEQMLGIKPIHTFFNADGSYKSEYYTLNDSLFMTNTGRWEISNDTLTMTQITPVAGVYKLKTSIEGSLATFEGMIDFDGDGKPDDHYLGRQRKR